MSAGESSSSYGEPTESSPLLRAQAGPSDHTRLRLADSGVYRMWVPPAPFMLGICSVWAYLQKLWKCREGQWIAFPSLILQVSKLSFRERMWFGSASQHMRSAIQASESR